MPAINFVCCCKIYLDLGLLEFSFIKTRVTGLFIHILNILGCYIVNSSNIDFYMRKMIADFATD